MLEVTKRKIVQYLAEKGFLLRDDLIIKEHRLKLIVNDEYYSDYFCTPSFLEELVLGSLAIEGLIRQKSDLKFIDINDDCIKVNISSSSETKKNVKSDSEIQIKASRVLELMDKHLDSSPLHKTTGGTHVMSLATNDDIIITCQDIGRHNALDKLYGCCLKNDIKLDDKILFSSGRITNEIAYKTLKMGVKVIVSRAMVSSMAIELAEAHGLTILGFTRGNRFNIYSNPHRIIE
ncbi:MAG TPA: formate dehydrogenase accessory sulfurtransferase FdhD [Syntrophomonadaceae bacterium]|nr:formate dehydrogenase accessory sulfurtransferase FdhD [Syntrophomonadaceae bacterium]